MKFTSIPENYDSFHDHLLYVFDTEATAHDVEIKILNAETSEEIGTKLMYGITKGEVDIAPYLRHYMSLEMPEVVNNCVELGLGQNIRVRVEADGVSSDERSFVAAKVESKSAWQLLTTQLHHRTMDCDEFDIISYYAPDNQFVEVVVKAFGKGSGNVIITPTAGGQRAVAVTAQGLVEEPDELKVTILVDGVEMEQITYSIKPNLRGARRLMWLNENHAPELYTFPLRKSVLTKATRKHIESVWGREAAALESENELKLISAYEPRVQIQALAAIVESQRLWLVRGGELQRVNLLSDRALVPQCGEMGMIEVDLRAAEEGVKLW